MKIKKFPIFIIMLMIVSSFSHVNVVVCETNENLVSIETDTNMWNFNSSYDIWECNNFSTGNATSGSYANSTIGYIFGQPKPNVTGSGKAKGWMRHSVEWDCPVNNESGVINISYEYGALASLKVNSSGYAYAKLWLTFFIDDIEHEVILYNNTIDTINESDNFNSDSTANWSKNLTLSNKTYAIGVNASYEIEYTGNDTESIAWLTLNVLDTTSEEGDGDTEYWAVLIGVDCFWDEFLGYYSAHFSFDEDVEQMKKMLLASDPDRWKEDHIKVLTNEKATMINIIRALLWLRSKDDGDDISLVYYTAHGYRTDDIPPMDEEDGYDEYLSTYWTKKLGIFIWDDLLKWLLDKLDSESVAVIVDGCYSGGMIDENASTWIAEFSGELNQDGRVIVTSCGENESSYVYGEGIMFSHFIMEGLQGYADNSSLCELGNGDGIVSIEEAFNYSGPRYKEYTDNKSNPVIYDSDNTSEIALTDVALPPNIPILYGDNITISQPGIPIVFNASSTDPEENDTISYGWDWSKDRFCEDISSIFWGQGGYDAGEWSDFYNSGDNCTMSHSWYEPAVYAIRTKAQDESGAERIESFAYSGLWSKPKYVIIKDEDEIIDQYQVMSKSPWWVNYGIAQSFKPNSSNGLSKVKLKLALSKDYYDYYSKNSSYGDFPLNVSIRKDLDGENLAMVSKIASLELTESKSLFDWIEFDFPNNCSTNYTETYFIVVEPHASVAEDPYYLWICSNEKDEYLQGESYWKDKSGVWSNESWEGFDFCFINYEALPVEADTGGPYYGLVNETIYINGSANNGCPPFNYLLDVIGPPCSSHTNTHYMNWSCDTPGNYTLKLKVTDNENNIDYDTSWINLRNYNNQPYAPSKPSGPTICKKDKNYNYSTNATDPDGDPMYYMWDWGDNTTSGWLGPVNSGQTHIASHSWSKWGFYKIKVKTKDVYGNETDWSEEKWVYVRLISGFNISPSVYMQSSQTVYFNNNSKSYYEIANWTWDFGDGNFSYTQNTSHTYATDGIYNVTLTITDNMSASNVSSQQICIDSVQPEINSVTGAPDNTVGFNSNIDINVDAYDDFSGVDIVKINVTYPDNSHHIFTLNNTNGSVYKLVFNDSWLVGQYNYTTWVFDKSNNSASSSGHNFNISMQGTISVCTIKDEYGNNKTINLTDPPSGSPEIGYDLLDGGDVLRIWNKYDSYYFDTDSGLQITNHYDKYWSHNVLMLGYYDNDEWNLIYRTDELSGFNKNIDTDGETYVNATLWKNLNYKGYDFRLAVRYHLGVDDNELTVIPYIKNLGEAIPYTLGFGWEMKDIQVDMTPSSDYININQTMYYLNQTIDNVYTDLSEPEFYLMENITDTSTKSLYLKWNQSLNYKLQVKSRDGQYNAPVTLFVRIGTLDADQEKFTEMYWYDAEEVTYYFNSYNTGEAWPTNPGYMVDGSTSTKASTTIDGDVELCNGNNCSGADLGTISRVELRVSSYYSGAPRDTILRPLFSGSIDGLDYHYGTYPSIEWSPWFDITYDPFAPQSWSWSDVKDLDCDVEAENVMMGLPFTLYCGKVEVRVTYTPWHPPVVSAPYPSDGSSGISIAPMLNITVSEPNGDSMDITWLSNSSGSWQVFGTNNSVSNGIYHQTMSNASVNGQWWYWKVNVTDSCNTTESSVYKFYTGSQSKIVNTGSTSIKGFLVIQIHYYNETLEQWIVADDTINETTLRIINSSEQLALDNIFNGLVNTNNLSGFGNGTYRVYACFRDPSGNVLVCDDETEMVATYEFTVTF